MKNVMTNGFCELNEQEMMEIDGGWNPFVEFGNWLKTTIDAIMQGEDSTDGGKKDVKPDEEFHTILQDPWAWK